MRFIRPWKRESVKTCARFHDSTFSRFHVSTVVWVMSVLGATVAFAQVVETRPPETAPATQPARIDEAFEARIEQVWGSVSTARVDEQGVRGEWRPAKDGDLLPAGTWIRTRVRSKVLLTFGDDTVVVIERATLASIDQFHRDGDAKVIKLGLGHGAVRAGVAETTLRSDMTIESPIATLSKKGTMVFRFEYLPGSHQFIISLTDEGLVEALNEETGATYTVRPGTYVTDAMMRWIDRVTFDRVVYVIDPFGQTDPEAWFNAMNTTGIIVVEPGGGATAWALEHRQGGELAAVDAANRAAMRRSASSLGLLPPGAGVRVRPEGNFGTGRGRLPSVIRGGGQ
jgi:hypothetical protein